MDDEALFGAQHFGRRDKQQQVIRLSRLGFRKWAVFGLSARERQGFSL